MQDNQSPLPDAIPVIEGYEPEAIAQREASVARGEVQNVGDWMPRRYGAYPLLSPSDANGGGTKTQIVNPAAMLTAWGISHYRYPIFAYEETMQWTRLRDGMGMNVNVPPALMPAALKTLKAMGVTKARRDVGWGNLDFTDKMKPAKAQELILWVKACASAGMRPLICLDTHPAAPCPIVEATVELVYPIKQGDTVATVKKRPHDPDPTPLRCGLSHVTAYWACEWMATEVNDLGDGVFAIQFGKPWTGVEHHPGSVLPFAYLKYRPFDATMDAQETYDGFGEYAREVCRVMDSAGLRKSATDPGYDIEICNEMSNWGFLQLNWYTGRASDGGGDTSRIYRECVGSIRANPAYDGIRLINGFRNQDPWGAASTEPAGSSSISNHFYRSPVPPNPTGEDAFGRTTTPDNLPLSFFTPPITIHAPETIFSAEVGENVVWNASPIKVQMWGNARGRGLQPRVNGADINSPVAKEPSGKPARGVELDFTEWSDAAGYDLPLSEQERLLAKFCLRGMVVGIGKGVSRIYWYAAMGPGHGLLSMRNDALPAKPSASVTLFKRFMATTKGRRITKPRHISVVSISETHGQVQFRGNGTPEFPDLPNRDVLLPQAFQLSDTSFAVSLHVMNKDYKQELPAANYTIRWSGVKPSAASVYRYRDLLKTRSMVVKPTAVGPDWVEFTLPVTDTPRLLIMEGV